jgi:hypothetical protein
MPLSGSGGPLGDVLASAVGAPSAVSGFFQQVGAVIASWAPANIQVIPGAMAATGSAVSGIGSFNVQGTKEDLGGRLADALLIPADAAPSRAKWVGVAGALIDHFNDYGQANGTGLLSGSPCTGAGTVAFTAPTFIPALSSVLGVGEPVAAGLLEAFALQLVSYIQANAIVVAVSLTIPPVPLSAPANGPVVGTGTIA